MRYSIIGATLEQVKNAGGNEIQMVKYSGIIFAGLAEDQVEFLELQGATVLPVVKVGVDNITPSHYVVRPGDVLPPVPPTPVEGAPTYLPYQLMVAAGYDIMRDMLVPPLYGSGFTVAIIDTGIRETHSQIGGHVVYSKNYTAAPMRDGFNHGTGVCGLAVSVAPEANILNMKVMDDNGDGTEEEVVMAIDDCIDLLESGSEYAPHVINLSLGAPDDGNPDNILRIICRAAISRGIWIFAATGNERTIMNPATERYVGAIGSIGYDPFVVSSYSGRGPTSEGLVKPDFVMFGENIITASSLGDTATIVKSGTSFAAPLISGMAVIAREGQYRRAVLTEPIPEIAWEQGWAMTEQILIDDLGRYICIKPLGAPAGKDNEYGWGMPFGTLVAQFFEAMAVSPINAVMSIMPVMLMVGVMGSVLKGDKSKSKSK